MHAVDSDGGSDIEFEMEKDSDASDSELEPEPECDTVPPAETPQAPLCKRARTEPTEQTQRTERARHGTVWEEQSVGGARSAGRLPAHMVLTETAGPTHHAKARIASRLDCFLSLVDTEMLTQIRDCSVAEACRTDAKLDLTVDELMAFIALCYERQKWTKIKRNFVPGDIVIIMDDSAPRNSWIIGRITETMPDRNGLVRQVRIKTRTSLLCRPVTKICLLQESTES
ncbi:hypothetical protein N1851_021894 [Merluccius polli]|uniref:DUF5641 domain-containing protein n=1 Tax=Merluccius polli TaxID=89951 RepID=A0AA47MJB1_MERPO|nr:hypothetical protein N1851_021894 [Merluccius polli]